MELYKELLDAATSFFAEEYGNIPDFFTRGRMCRNCRTSYSLYGLITEGTVRTCPVHPGRYDGFEQKWTCCSGKGNSGASVNTKHGCTLITHDLDGLCAESKRLGFRYVGTENTSQHARHVYMYIPIKIWLGLMYKKYGGSIISFRSNMSKIIHHIHHTIKLADEKKCWDFMNLEVRESSPPQTSAIQQLLSETNSHMRKNLKLVKGMTSDDHTITLLVDSEERMDIEHSDDDETEPSISIAKLKQEKKKTDLSLFEQNYNNVIIVYECHM